MDEPIDKRFAVLCEIVRAQHFAWRQAAAELCPEVDPAEVVHRMWDLTGRQTAAAYLRRLDPAEPLAPQVAESIAWSSRCMGEDALVEPGEGDEAYVRHRDCPWKRWHEKNGVLGECRPGCDSWFGATLATVNEKLGARLRFETLEALPEGGPSCLRRLWTERGEG